MHQQVTLVADPASSRAQTLIMVIAVNFISLIMVRTCCGAFQCIYHVRTHGPPLRRAPPVPHPTLISHPRPYRLLVIMISSQRQGAPIVFVNDRPYNTSLDYKLRRLDTGIKEHQGGALSVGTLRIVTLSILPVPGCLLLVYTMNSNTGVTYIPGMFYTGRVFCFV